MDVIAVNDVKELKKVECFFQRYFSTEAPTPEEVKSFYIDWENWNPETDQCLVGYDDGLLMSARTQQVWHSAEDIKYDAFVPHIAQVDYPVGYLSTVVVSPEFRGNGVATLWSGWTTPRDSMRASSRIWCLSQ